MADETAAPRDIYLLTIDALLADLIGGRPVALGGGVSCCRFGGHRDKVFYEAGGCYGEADV